MRISLSPVSLCPPQIPHDIEPGSPGWEAGDYAPDLWHGLTDYKEIMQWIRVDTGMSYRNDVSASRDMSAYIEVCVY
jgi:hypothetical protein